jgi:hypothetical protein
MTARAPVPFAGSNLNAYRHVCAFFTTPDEEYRTMPFVRDGLAQGDRVFHVTDRRLRANEFLRELEERCSSTHRESGDSH